MQNHMALADMPEGIRFGRTVVVAVVGNLLEQHVEGVVVPANGRGVMGAISTPGMVGLRSLGGSEIERQAMAQAPLELGSALITSAIGLESRGVRNVIHAIVHRSLGTPARVEDVRRATAAVLIAADRVRLRSLAMPPLGVGSGLGHTAPDAFVTAIVEEMVAALRRSTLRFDRVVVACRFQDHADTVHDALRRARDRSWTRNL